MSNYAIPMPKKKKKLLFFAFLTTLLLVSAIVSIVAGVNSRKNSSSDPDNIHFTQSHHIVKTACSSTLYPELCFSAITAEPGFAEKVSTHRDVIELSLNVTIRSIRMNKLTVNRIKVRKGLTKRQKAALHDCLETIQDTLSRLHRVIADLKDSKNRADDIKTFLSSAITDQETCRDGFSHSKADRRLRKGLDNGQVHVERLCSNALAMFKNMTYSEMPSRSKRNLMEMVEVDGGTWPAWLSAEDRRLLLSDSVTPNVVVAADGSGNYRTVSEAVAAAPKSTEISTSKYVIKIKAGVYRENVEVPSNKWNIMLLGESRTNTIITASKSVGDGVSTTFNSGTVIVTGDGFLAREITFQNTAGPTNGQAVALRVGADLSAFYRCAFLAYQDTLYVHSNRQFFTDCVVVGTVDFIFGFSAAVLQNCDIRPRLPLQGQSNMVTASGRSDVNQNTGIVIQNSKITANNDLVSQKGSVKSYLGRPWGEYARTVIMETYIDDVIDPQGWHEWVGNKGLDTLFYGEYKNSGTIGADTSQRVTWKGFKVITDVNEANTYTAQNFIDGNNWIPSTNFPYTPGLVSQATK